MWYGTAVSGDVVVFASRAASTATFSRRTGNNAPKISGPRTNLPVGVFSRTAECVGNACKVVWFEPRTPPIGVAEGGGPAGGHRGGMYKVENRFLGVRYLLEGPADTNHHLSMSKELGRPMGLCFRARCLYTQWGAPRSRAKFDNRPSPPKISTEYVAILKPTYLAREIRPRTPSVSLGTPAPSLCPRPSHRDVSGCRCRHSCRRPALSGCSRFP